MEWQVVLAISTLALAILGHAFATVWWAAQIQAETLNASRSVAKDSVDQLSPEGVRLRASLLVVMDRFNTVTERLDAIESCIENSGTLAAVKTCLGGLSPIGTATAPQLKTAIKNKIDAGSAD